MAFLTRRQTLAGIAATGGIAVVGGGIGMALDHRGSLVREILHRSIGDFRMADDDFAALLQDIDKPFAPSRQRLAFYRAVMVGGSDRVPELVPHRIAEEFQQYERRVVTAFMIQTDYLALDPGAKQVRFIGDSACHSPFARFT